MSPMFPQVLAKYFKHRSLVVMGGSRGGDRGSDPPEKSQKIRVSKQYWPRSPEKSQSYQASIQCWAIIGPPAFGITYWIRAWLYFKELDFRKDIQKASFQLVHPLRMLHLDFCCTTFLDRHNVRSLSSS